MFNAIRAMQLQARRDRDQVKTNLYTTLIGELQRSAAASKDVTDDQVFKAASVMLNKVNETLQAAPGNITLIQEVTLLEDIISRKPAAPTDEEIAAVVREVLESTPDAKKGDVMGKLKGQYGARLDGKAAFRIVTDMITAQ